MANTLKNPPRRRTRQAHLGKVQLEGKTHIVTFDPGIGRLVVRREYARAADAFCDLEELVGLLKSRVQPYLPYQE